MALLPDYFPLMYDLNWRNTVQQRVNRLRPYVTFEDVKGREKQMMFDTEEPLFSVITDPHAPNTQQAFSGTKRFLRKSSFDNSFWEPEYLQDTLDRLSNPRNNRMMKRAWAWGRLAERVILEAALGNAYEGEAGTSAVALPASQSIAVNWIETAASGANTGLTMGKLRRTKYLFDTNEVPEDEPRVFVCRASQIQDLLATLQVTSSDYNTVKALAAGEVDTFCGFKFIRTEQVAVDGSDIASCAAWVASAIAYNESNVAAHTDILPGNRHSLQMRHRGDVGATRTEEKKVVKILCDQSP